MADKFSDIPKIMERAFKKMTNKTHLRIVGEDAKRLIQKRTRLGGGVEKSLGTRRKLKKLSKSYKKQRKGMKLDRTTSPAKSNVTQTGEMLREIGVKVRSNKALLRFISPSAKKKAKWVQDAGRKFFNISQPELKQLTRLLRKRVNRILKTIK